MRLPRFECLYPTTIEEAVSLLDKHRTDEHGAEHRDEARIIAGGTDLVVAMKQRRATPKFLINLKSVAELYTISFDQADGVPNGASIGASNPPTTISARGWNERRARPSDPQTPCSCRITARVW